MQNEKTECENTDSVDETLDWERLFNDEDMGKFELLMHHDRARSLHSYLRYMGIMNHLVRLGRDEWNPNGNYPDAIGLDHYSVKCYVDEKQLRPSEHFAICYLFQSLVERSPENVEKYAGNTDEILEAFTKEHPELTLLVQNSENGQQHLVENGQRIEI